MQSNSQTNVLRYVFIISTLVLICAIFAARLVSMQIIDPPDNSSDNNEKQYIRTETIIAQRGEIYDRNGVALVTNEYYRSIIFDYGDFPWTQAESNTLILECVRAIERTDGVEALSVVEYFPFEDVFSDVRYKEDYVTGDNAFRLEKMLARYEQKADTSASDFLAYLMKRWALVDSDGEYVYSEQDTYTLLCRRYDMSYKQFGEQTPYVLCEDATISAISSVLELNLRGVTTKIGSQRNYEYPGYLSHILGRVGKIPAEQQQKYMELGYPMDAFVGLDGVELAFESYLRGTDGVITVVEDEDGNIIDRYISKQPIAGRDVHLTIDIELQIVAEDSLAYRIQKVAADGAAAGGDMAGAEADAGAIVAIDAKTNGVLCIASYPTYDLSQFDLIYSEIVNDSGAPLLNRAINSAYAPGSTFKLATSLAALSEGLIDKDTKIKDLGIYSYYDDYRPHCWIYDMYGSTHGSINVVGAIKNSCNYFYFEVGRQLGIQKLNAYSTAFGLGKPTGIELPETTGILAGPEYAETSGIGTWVPGDTLAASIGQSYNLFTPMQLACYVSTFLNNGTRYSAHLLDSVYDFSSGEAESVYENRIMDGCISLKSSHVNLVKQGMLEVMSANLTKAAFKDLVAVRAAGKTGTAQIGGGASDNATFVSFAPYDSEPEIIVAGIIENGVTGNNTAYVISDIMEQYFQGEANIG